MRIAQITDIHIGGARECPHQIDCRAQFRATLDAVNLQEPDVIVLTGDLCFRDPEGEAYSWIASQLSALPCDVIIQAGNHDSQQSMRKYFDIPYHIATDEIYSLAEWEGHQVFFLDTARGVMSATQYDWLAEHIATPAPRVIFFMHHPPVYCGVPHMDVRYAFQQIPEFQQFVSGIDAEIIVYCGHYHVERTLIMPGQTIYITPSTFFQINAWQEEFAIDHHRPGYRMIELTEDGVSSRCLYTAPVRVSV